MTLNSFNTRNMDEWHKMEHRNISLLKATLFILGIAIKIYSYIDRTDIFNGTGCLVFDT